MSTWSRTRQFIYATDGSHLGTIRTGTHNANCCFGGPDGTTLFITAGNDLARLPVLIDRPDAME